MVPSEGSPGSSLDLSSDVDVFPISQEAKSSQNVSRNGARPISPARTTDNSPKSSASMSRSRTSPVEVTSHEMQGTLVDTTISQNGTLKRKRGESDDPASPGRAIFTPGEKSRENGETNEERSQKRSQNTLDQAHGASMQNGFHSIEGTSLVLGPDTPPQIPSSPQLSPEIWQHVFSFVPPVFLGRLLRVNRSFKKMLTPTDTRETPPATTGALPYRPAQSVWGASRKRFCPGLPKSVPGLNDLQMWRLLRGNNCQICGTIKPLATTHASPDPWRSGPGSDAVRVFWAFGIRSCGPCMRNTSEKEVTVLYSSTFPAVLMPALTCVFISQEDHLVASNELRTRSPPEDVVLTKVFYKPQMEEIKIRVQRVILDHGSAAVEEWVKGLDDEGRDRGEEVIRWENWEAKGGLEKVNIRPPKRKPAPIRKQAPKAMVKPTEPPVEPRVEPSIVRPVPIPPARLTGSLALPEKPVVVESFYPRPPPLGKPLAWRPSEHSFMAVPEPLPQRPLAPLMYNRFERSIHDVTEAKAARRADIERRCMSLDPPLKANVLQHMDTFQAAVQIPSYLTDTAWEVLKPRLLAQREAAENRENERIHQEMLQQVHTEELRQQEEHEKDSKDNFEKEWEAAQAPIRLRLGAYADQMIKQSWNGGACITKENSPKFAVDVLLWARERFFDDQQKQDETLRAAGGEVIPDEPDGPPTRRLILENMKWLYENKIRPYTDDFQRDLFLCSSCDGKFYGFEGVIQHYAAKHTSSMSLGNAVVHWRADWPNQPPFNSNPLTAVAAQSTAPMPVVGTQIQTNGTDQDHSMYGGQAQNAVSGTQSGMPSYSASQYPSAAYTSQYQIQPSQTLLPQENVSYQGQAVSGQAQPSMYSTGSSYPTLLADKSTYGGMYPQNEGQTYPLPSYAAPNGQVMYPVNTQATTMAPAYTSYATANVSPYSTTSLSAITVLQSTTTPENARLAPAQAADLYNEQMDEMAGHARDVWFTTSGIKDIPHSVRIYTVIHQVCSRYAKKYTNEPGLSMFLDGLNRVATMRPVRSVNGLVCASCTVNERDPQVPSHPQLQNALGAKKSFTLPLILNHFRAAHIDPALQQPDQSRKPDWRFDMVRLPDPTTISNLIYAHGMDKKKLQVLSEVFPTLFPASMPKANASEQYYSLLKPDGGQPGALSILQKFKANQSAQTSITYGGRSDIQPYDPGYDENLSDSRPYSPATARASEPPGEDEYDPRRPEFLGRMVTPNSAGALSRKGIAPEHEPTTITHVSVQKLSPSDSHMVQIPSDPAPFQEPGLQEASDRSSIYPGTLPGYFTNPNTSGGTNGRSHHVDRISNPPVRSPPKAQQIEHLRYPVNGSLNQSGLSSEQQTPSSKTFVGSEAERFLKEFEANNSFRRAVPVLANERFGTSPPREEQENFYTRRRSPSIEQASQTAYEIGQRSRSSMPLQTAVYQDQWSRQSSQPSSTPLPLNYVERRYYDPRDQGPPSEVRRAYEADNRPHYQQHEYQHANAIHHANNDKVAQPTATQYYSTQQPVPSQYRDASPSPRVVALPPGHYRQRTPAENTRQEYYYPVARADSHERQPVYYNYPPAQEEYTYVRDHQPSEALPPRRVEYIPVREDEYAVAQRERYVIAQAAPEAGGVSERVRYVRYPQEQVYEQPGGGTYYADQAVYEPRQARTVYQPMEGPGLPMQRPRY